MKFTRYILITMLLALNYLHSHYAEIIIALDRALQENGTLGEMFQLDSLLEIVKEYEETKHEYSQSENLVIQTALDRIIQVLLATKTCAASVSPEIALILPTTSAVAQYQVLTNTDITLGQLGWMTVATDGQVNLLVTATSYDIPLTLILRDSTGSFAATTATLQSLVITPTTTQGCIIFTDSSSNTIGNICVNQQAMILAPVPPRAIQAANDTLVRGVSAIDLQMSNANTTQIASGNYAVVTGGQNNSASGAYSVIAGGLSNIVTPSFSAVSGGSTNTILGYNSFIGSGFANTVTGNYSAIVSGTGNFIGNDFSVIVAGQSNIITNSNSFIGSGNNNLISQPSSGIFTGQLNTATLSAYCFIGSGQFNAPTGIASGILTGSNNTVGNAGLMCGTCIAGQSNTAYGFISGNAFIGAGNSNVTINGSSGILAGAFNSEHINFAAIMSGLNNLTGGNSSGFIGSGQFNALSGTSCVLSGSNNAVSASSGCGAILAGQSNSTQFEGFVGSGIANNGNVTPVSAIMSGSGNTAGVSSASVAPTVMGGQANRALVSNSFIAGGFFNTNSNGGTGESGILTGSGNTTVLSGPGSIIISGQANTTSQSFVGGGYFNACSTIAGSNSAILSGSGNRITQNFSMILGGVNNSCTQGINSLAIGTNGSSSRGSFLWTDNSATSTVLTIINQFVVRASGGSYFYTSSAGASGPGVQLAPGGGSWNNISDKNLKINFKSIDPSSITGALAHLPITEWNYITQDPSIVHIGPMAQDFNATYGYGEHQKYINTSDALGVLFCYLQGLYTFHERTSKYVHYKQRINILKNQLYNLEHESLL